MLLLFVGFKTAVAGTCKSGDIKNWKTCKADADCAVGENMCYGWEAYNKDYLGKVDDYNRCMRPAIKCARYKGPGKAELKALCRQEKCELDVIEVSKNPVPSQPEQVCKLNGGKWEGLDEGRGRLTGCSLPTKDFGKKCGRGEDCESVCLKDGTCHGWSQFKGCARFKGGDGIVCRE